MQADQAGRDHQHASSSASGKAFLWRWLNLPHDQIRAAGFPQDLLDVRTHGGRMDFDDITRDARRARSRSRTAQERSGRM